MLVLGILWSASPRFFLIGDREVDFYRTVVVISEVFCFGADVLLKPEGLKRVFCLQVEVLRVVLQDL